MVKPTESPAPKTPEKKRGHYKQKECPFCGAMVGNLGNHVQLKHPTEKGAAPREITKEDLLGQHPAAPGGDAPARNPASPPPYYCQDCKAELRKGEASCWQCGAALDWSAIE